MAIPRYLAMTATEFDNTETLPQHTAWMACHFSCYGTGLSNLPTQLPKDAMVIINDRTPVMEHDPERILQQLIKLWETRKPKYFLLDLQRAEDPLSFEIAQLLAANLPCPVGVSEYYARELQCPVFVAPPPLHVPLKKHLAPWLGREIWLEAAIETELITVTKEGSQFKTARFTELDDPVFQEEALHCRYHIRLTENAAIFELERRKEELEALLEEAEKTGVTLAVGLYQQLGQT